MMIDDDEARNRTDKYMEIQYLYFFFITFEKLVMSCIHVAVCPRVLTQKSLA